MVVSAAGHLCSALERLSCSSKRESSRIRSGAESPYWPAGGCELCANDILQDDLETSAGHLLPSREWSRPSKFFTDDRPPTVYFASLETQSSALLVFSTGLFAQGLSS